MSDSMNMSSKTKSERAHKDMKNVLWPAQLFTILAAVPGIPYFLKPTWTFTFFKHASLVAFLIFGVLAALFWLPVIKHLIIFLIYKVKN